jgi:polyhydroxyalkanoate synthesis regulator phasin
MGLMSKLKIAGVLVAVAVVAGGGAAIAATKVWSPHEESQAVIDDAAKQLGVTPAQLSDALKQALENRIDEAVADGRLTKAQGDELKKRIESSDVPFPFGFLGPHPGLKSFGFYGPFVNFATAASYLGLTPAQLRTKLGQGKSLAQIAKDEGKPVDGLVQALVKAADDRIDAAVASGKLTKSEADEVKTDVKDRITDLVNGAFERHPFGFKIPWDGFRGFDRFRGPRLEPGFPGFGGKLWPRPDRPSA